MTLIDFRTYFKRNIIFLRKSRGLLQKDLADIFELKRSTIGAMEEGRAISVKEVVKYSQYFKISIDKLLTEFLTIKDLKQ